MLTTLVVIGACIFVFPGQLQLARTSNGWLFTWRPLWQVVIASPVQQAQPVASGSERHTEQHTPATNGVLETV